MESTAIDQLNGETRYRSDRFFFFSLRFFSSQRRLVSVVDSWIMFRERTVGQRSASQSTFYRNADLHSGETRTARTGRNNSSSPLFPPPTDFLSPLWRLCSTTRRPVRDL